MGKLLGAALIAAAALWAFTAHQRRALWLTQLLRELAAALDAMAAAIRWQKKPLPDILSAMQRYPLAGGYFHRVEKLLQVGMPLQKAWHLVFSTLPAEAEPAAALELTGDEEKLTAALLYATRQLKDTCRRRGEQQKQSTKLWLAGLLSAAGLLIILLL